MGIRHYGLVLAAEGQFEEGYWILLSEGMFKIVQKIEAPDRARAERLCHRDRSIGKEHLIAVSKGHFDLIQEGDRY